jgi:hypothetical protein
VPGSFYTILGQLLWGAGVQSNSRRVVVFGVVPPVWGASLADRAGSDP